VSISRTLASVTTPVVTVITPTGYRPESISLCKKMLEAQTYPLDKIHWIIINDGNIDDVPFWGEPENKRKINTFIAAGPLAWQEGYNTQRYSLEHAIDVCNKASKHIVIWEDDDFYTPTYIESYVALLQHFDLVGEGNAKYYHLPTKSYREMENYEHTSLASLAFNMKILPTFKRALHSGEKFFDITFWELAKKERINSMLFTNKNLSIGIKGMLGRRGIGVGHTPIGYTSDPFLGKLREWVGEEGVKMYEPYVGKKKTVGL